MSDDVTCMCRTFVKECLQNPQIFEGLVILKNIIAKTLNLLASSKFTYLEDLYVYDTSILKEISPLYNHLYFTIYRMLGNFDERII